MRDVAGDLELGSAGRERAGQAHDQHLLAGAGLPHVEEHRRVELEAVLRAWRGRVLAGSLTLRVPFRPGDALTTVSRLRALRSSREACSTRAAALARRRRARDLASLQLWDTVLHAWTCTSGIESPAFTMAASERERFAAGGSVFALYEACGRAYNNDKWQCQPSEGEALSAWSLGVEASRAVPGTPQRTTTARPDALG